MRFQGKFRLVFGVPGDPAAVSGVLSALSVHGAILSANGVPFAVYEPDRDMWRGAVAETWWHSFRLESTELRSIPEGATKQMNDPMAAIEGPRNSREQKPPS
jgi:hypothetical protein